MAALDWAVDSAGWPHRDASSFVSAAGMRWHVQRFGPAVSAVRILLLHGTGASSHSFRLLAPRLSSLGSVLSLDLPGHAFTDAPPSHRMSLEAMSGDLHELLVRLDFAPQIVVAHSAGAAIAVRMALDGKITPGLIVAINGAFLPFGGAASHFFTPLARMLSVNPLVPRLFAWQAARPGAVERLIRNTGSHLDHHGVALYRRLIAAPGHVDSALQMMSRWQLQPLLAALPRLKAKLILIAASGDSAVPASTAREVKALLPRAQIVSLGGCGHLAHEERPDEVARIITSAWQTLAL